MERISIKSFAKTEGFTKIFPTVRASINNRPYVTFLKPSKVEGEKAIAENVYFSKTSCEAGDAPAKGDNFFEVAFNWEIGYVTNAEGEVRIKLMRKGTSGYMDIDMLD